MIPHIPLEIQDLILEEADISQYSTLTLVCKGWKESLNRILRKKYCEIPVRDMKWVDARVDGEPLPEDPPNIPSNTSSKILIHSAIAQFPGYLRGRISKAPFVFIPAEEEELQKTPTNPKIVAYHRMIRNSLNDPIILSKIGLEETRDLGYYLRICVMKTFPPRYSFPFMKTLELSEAGEILTPGRTMKVKKLLCAIFARYGTKVCGEPESEDEECLVAALHNPALDMVGNTSPNAKELEIYMTMPW